MQQTVVAVTATLLSMGILDAIWLTTMTSRLYRQKLSGLLLDTPNWAPALAFYLLYGVGVVVLVVRPALEGDWSLGRAVAIGALLGLVAYGTYDLTNQATVRGWSLVVTAVDMAWGASLTATVAAIAIAAARRFT
jgi:uncharacterized membrane protein